MIVDDREVDGRCVKYISQRWASLSFL